MTQPTTPCDCDGGYRYAQRCECHDDRESNCPEVVDARVVCEDCGGTGVLPVEEEE
jgi:hypothetical protein